MEEVAPIQDLDARLDRILDALVGAARSEFDSRIPISDHDDQLVDVEVVVNMMLSELDLARRENEAQRREIDETTAALAERQERLVRALSTPIIVVWPGVLALPIIGPIDRARGAAITEALLARVAAEQTTHVILDVTGVGEPDQETAHAFLKTARVVALLGAQCLMTGVTPAMARAMVELGQDFAVPTRQRLSDALAWIIATRGETRSREAASAQG